MKPMQQSTMVKAKYTKGEATLDKIREATLEEIISRGYHRTSVCDIVKRAKMTRGAFYNYWPSLDACLSDLILAMQESIRNNPDAVSYYNELSDPSETIKKVKLTMYLVLSDKYRFILLPASLLQEKDLPGDALKQHLRDYMDDLNQEWIEVIQRDQEKHYIIPGLDPQTIASGIMNLMTGFFHNCELHYNEFSKPMENALILFLLASLTENYREEHRLKTLLPEDHTLYTRPVLVKS